MILRLFIFEHFHLPIGNFPCQIFGSLPQSYPASQSNPYVPEIYTEFCHGKAFLLLSDF